MLINAGLFVLLWECLTVLLAGAVKLFNPGFGLEEMLIQGVLILPLAVALTMWVDHHIISAPRGGETGIASKQSSRELGADSGKAVPV